VSTKHRPLNEKGPVCLKAHTSPKWLPLALGNFDAVLNDHAHCEKKAAANALSMLQAYPTVPGLPAQMARLAREESAHLARVLAAMEERGLTLSRDPGDPYAQGLLALARTPSAERRLDRFLIAGIIEARSCERLALLAHGLAEEKSPLARLYQELAQSEDGHQELFYRLAEKTAGEEEATQRLDVLLDAEVKLIHRLPLRSAIH
jgi:tRNA-(ms[2]io[6]A)-hydroxylase